MQFVRRKYVTITASRPGDVWLQACSEENDLNHSGGINFREFQSFVLNLMNLNRAELERLFLIGDVDRNSELDGEECVPMRAVLKSTLREKSELLMKKYDVDGDHRLSQSEAVAMAKNDFSNISVDEAFALSDQNKDQFISGGDEMTGLMLNMRTRMLADGQERLAKFDKNHDGKVSYEEIKPEVLRIADGFTLKQVFKAVDADKDFYLTPKEYLALLTELEVREKVGNLTTSPRTINMAVTTNVPPIRKRFERVSSTTETTIVAEDATLATSISRASDSTSTTAPSDAIKDRVRRNADRGMVKVAASRVLHEPLMDAAPLFEGKAFDAGKITRTARMLRIVEGNSPRRKREDETAPKVEVPKEELKKEMQRLLSETVKYNLSGGGRKPSIDESITVPYDSKDYQ